MWRLQRNGMVSIKDNVIEIIGNLPSGIELVAAVKERETAHIMEAVDAGIKIIGENYVQEAAELFGFIGNKVKWHFIGHLQKNKARKAVNIFDMIETVDSIDIAVSIASSCAKINKTMDILVEINSGRESQKSGVMPEDAEGLIRKLSSLSNIKVMGLMTMGPDLKNPEDVRPYFNLTKKIFEDIKALNLQNIMMKYLSMGMTHTYNIAIEEGANIVRIGTGIFGER